MLIPLRSPVYTFTGMLLGRSYLIEDEDGLTLVDAGMRTHWRRITSEIARSGRDVRDVRRILITHAHPDHAGNLPGLKAATGATVYASAVDADVVEGKLPMESGRLLPGMKTPALLSKSLLPPCKVDVRLQENDRVPAFGGLQAILAPGHTRGEMVYWQEENRVLFCGDVAIVFPRLRPPFGIFTSDVRQNNLSIEKISRLKPETLYPGHGPPILHNAAEALRRLARKVQ